MSRCRDRQALYLRALNPRAIQATANGELSAAGPITTTARVVVQSGGGPLITKSSHPPDRTSHKRKKPRRHFSFFISPRSSLKAEGLAAVRASACPRGSADLSCLPASSRHRPPFFLISSLIEGWPRLLGAGPRLRGAVRAVWSASHGQCRAADRKPPAPDRPRADGRVA